MQRMYGAAEKGVKDKKRKKEKVWWLENESS
jgi:hypothetical protein